MKITNSVTKITIFLHGWKSEFFFATCTWPNSPVKAKNLSRFQFEGKNDVWISQEVLMVWLSISLSKLPWWELIKILVEKLHAHQNRNAPSGLTSTHCDWVCHAMHKNVCMLEWHAIKHPYLPTYLGCMIKLLIYFYAS